MSLSSVTSARAPSNPAPRTDGPARAPKPDDLRAMTDAFAKAGRREAPVAGDGGKALRKHGQAPAGQGRPQPAMTGEARPQGEAHAAGLPHEAPVREREEQGGQGGYGGQPGSAPPPAAVAMPAMPAPHVDPGAFAALMTQLWSREQGKGPRDITVHFGVDAWPATGARLVRAANGALDVALLVGDRGRAYGDGLPGLRERFAERGLAIGALAVAEDDAG